MHEITVSAPAERVFEAWTTKDGLRAWWTPDVVVPPAQGDQYVFGFDGGRVQFHFRVDEHIPGKRILWTGVEGQKMPAEWVGTRIDVRLSTVPEDRTRMQFVHRGWRSIEGAYCECNTTWGELMYRLRDWCEGRARGPLFAG
jgi:uncharacterized protein YndB with AHSA1/START domain